MNKEHFRAAYKFGRKLIETGDLDPVYIALAKSGMTQAQLARTIVAYSCLYHLSSAAYIGQYKEDEFWDKLEDAAENDNLKWPRGSERRHWRGTAATDCVEYLRRHYNKPEELIEDWAVPRTAMEVIHRVQRTPQFGPWIAFKIADILERVMRFNIDFREIDLGIYSEPRKGAALILTGDSETKISNEELRHSMYKLALKLVDLNAPPWYDRKINKQEIETVLCKYKSHVNGHYKPGKDTQEIALTLREDAFKCPSVRNMLEAIEDLKSRY